MLVTNCNRFVGFPFITSLNKRSPLYEKYKGNELYILHFKTEKLANVYVKKYNSTKREYVLDPFTKKKREHVKGAVHISTIT